MVPVCSRAAQVSLSSRWARGLPKLQRFSSMVAATASRDSPVQGTRADAAVPAVERFREASLTTFPKGTPMDDDPKLLSVLSYNLLAPLFVRPVDLRTGQILPYAAFPWAEPAEEVLDWEVRRPRLLAELRTARCDVICLQEVQFERSAEGRFVLPSWLEMDGYSSQIPDQSPLQQMAERNLRVLGSEVAIGTALLYRSDRLEGSDASLQSTNTCVAACLRGRSQSKLSALGWTVFFSVHLDATHEEKRVAQLEKCLKMVREAGLRETLVVGDMNTECLPGSCVGAFIAGTAEPSPGELAKECAVSLRIGSSEGEDGEPSDTLSAEARPTEADLQQWDQLWERAASAGPNNRIALSHVPTGTTRAAHEHGKSCGPCVSWRLDHIFFTPRTLALRGVWEALEGDPESEAAGLPNLRCPSDHLPVAAVFEPSPTPVLDDSGRSRLEAQIFEMEQRHAAQREALEREVAAFEPPAPAAACQADGSTSDNRGKNKVKKNEKPSPEVIAFIQEKRRRTRELKAEQALEREHFLGALGELELDALETVVRGIVRADAWIEWGIRQS